MEPTQFFAASRVAIVAGKGGVGKTTVSATLATAAARSGLDTLIVEVEGTSGLPVLFDHDELGYDEVTLVAPGPGTAGVRARTLTPDEALLEYLRDNGLGRLSRRLVQSGALDMVSTAIPGIKDILVLGKVKQIEVKSSRGAKSAPDFIVIDAPAAGHAITFLQSARGLADAVTVGPLNKQACDVLALLTEPGRSQVLLVCLPEETPVNELVDTAFALEDKIGISLGPVVVNGLYDDVPGLHTPVAAAAEAAGATLRPGEAESLAAAADFRARRSALQAEQLARLADRLPLPQIHLPFLFDADLGLAQLDVLADRFLAGVAALPDVPAGATVSSLAELVEQRAILICCGSGGVGKTTTAAVVAMEAARRGRRAVVVTIDPAKRLADALGISGGIGNVPTRIDGPWPGELSAVMLDTKSTFDAVVAQYAEDDVQAERILANRFYRNISGALSGTQEYMAMEKLYELHNDDAFDIVVVDTPPTRRALDFVDAPRRLVRFLDHRLYRILTAPSRGALKVANVATQTFVRGISKVAGAGAFEDAIAFFQAFEGMEEGFKERARHVLEALDDPATAFVLVASPHRDTVTEARFFADKLAENGIAVQALVVNRIHPRFTDAPPEALAERSRTLAGTDLGGLYANLADFTRVGVREEGHLEGLAEQVVPAPVVRVPFLTTDVHDLDGLAVIGAHLFPDGA